jgi:hypothetical protein
MCAIVHRPLAFLISDPSYLLPDYPHNTGWMSEEERRLAQARIAEDAGEADRDNKEDSCVYLAYRNHDPIERRLSPWKGLVMAVKDVKVWILAFIAMTETLGLSFVNFFPTYANNYLWDYGSWQSEKIRLTATLGFSTTITLLLAAKVFQNIVWATILIWLLLVLLGFLQRLFAVPMHGMRVHNLNFFIDKNSNHCVDRTGERFFHIASWWWGVAIGFIISLSTMNIAARYVSMFLMASGYTGMQWWL